MADTTPEAPADVKTPESEATPDTNTNTEQKPAEQPDLQGFTPEQLKEMKAFYDANGGFEKVKSRISNPTSEPKQETPPQTPPETLQAPQPPEQPQVPTSPQQPPQTPAGAVTQDEVMTQYYFEQLSKQEKYAPIAKEIANGSLLKEMSALGIEIKNPDGSFNDTKINTYLGIKAQTVPAKPTGSEPDASSAPTVFYTPVGDEIKSMEEAKMVLTQQGHPAHDKAVEFMKKTLNPAQSTGQKQ